MRRRLLRIVLSLSLLLCAAVLAMQLRSHFRNDTAGFVTALRPFGGCEWSVRSNDGVLLFARSKQWVSPVQRAALYFESGPAYQTLLGPVQGGFGTFGVGSYRNQFGSFAGVQMPHGFLAVIVGLPFVVWILYRRIWPAYPKGACPACGYDLRATPERCPECGAVPAGAGK
jgi:hypothetical protein